MGSHWTERARLLWPVRRLQVGLVAAYGFSLVLFAALNHDRQVLTSYHTIGVMCGYLGGSFFFTRQIEPRYRFFFWLYELFWALLIQFGIIGILGTLLFTMPTTLTPADWLHVALGLLAVVVIATGIWLPLFKLFPTKPQPGEQRLLAIVQEVAAQTGITPRWTFYGKSPQARAAALVYLRSLVVSSRVMEVLDDDELRAILHHEMSHLHEGLAVRLSRLLPLAGFAVFIFIHPVLHHFGPLGIVGLFACLILCNKIARNIARRMEHQADAAAIQGADAVKYAHALEKFYEANQLPAVMHSNRMTHPHLYDRMLAAGVTPDYPRPDRPGPMPWPGWLVLLLPVALLISLMTQSISQARWRRGSKPPAAKQIQQ